MTGKSSLIAGNVVLLEQGRDLIEILRADAYTASSRFAPGGTVGSHFRHCLDVYGCLFRDLGTGRVDYDRRERNPEVESRADAARAALGAIAARLRRLEAHELERAIVIRGEATTDEGWTASSVARELQYVMGHTIHHYALIGFILREHGVAVAPEFGVAPSTLRHWRDHHPQTRPSFCSASQAVSGAK